MALGAELALIRKLRHTGLLQMIDELDTPLEWYFVMELFPVYSDSFCSPVTVCK